MARILLVDNDKDWLDLIKGSLPEHQVDTASSYKEAEQAIRSGITYDVAIVDLNLIDSPYRSTLDGLGGKILRLLRVNFPEIRRIALTAYSPSSAKQVIDQYAVDDLLLKGNMALSVVPEVVEAALALTSAELPPGARARRSELQQDFGRWQQRCAVRFERLLRNARNELGSTAIRLGEDDPIVMTLRAQLPALESRQEAFNRECSRVAAMLSHIGSVENVTLEQREIDKLKQEFGTDDTDGLSGS